MLTNVGTFDYFATKTWDCCGGDKSAPGHEPQKHVEDESKEDRAYIVAWKWKGYGSRSCQYLESAAIRRANKRTRTDSNADGRPRKLTRIDHKDENKDE